MMCQESGMAICISRDQVSFFKVMIAYSGVISKIKLALLPKMAAAKEPKSPSKATKSQKKS
ncbi:hypothetical protein R6Q57_014631 [Mikania cordata]